MSMTPFHVEPDDDPPTRDDIDAAIAAENQDAAFELEAHPIDCECADCAARWGEPDMARLRAIEEWHAEDQRRMAAEERLVQVDRGPFDRPAE